MPYEWVKRPNGAPEQSGALSRHDDQLAELHLWPYRSLPRKGFVIFIGLTVAMLALPLLTLLGSFVLWGILPFFALALAGVWWGLSRSYRDGEILEILQLWPDRVELTRHQHNKPEQHWQANPYWVRSHIHPSGGPVPNYLTLKGDGREVEIGAFLSEDERLALRGELDRQLKIATQP